jgi:hypothetical protein
MAEVIILLVEKRQGPVEHPSVTALFILKLRKTVLTLLPKGSEEKLKNSKS